MCGYVSAAKRSEESDAASMSSRQAPYDAGAKPHDEGIANFRTGNNHSTCVVRAGLKPAPTNVDYDAVPGVQLVSTASIFAGLSPCALTKCMVEES
jgi:hypothetical protein